MDKVSVKKEHGIESKYFDIKYRPSENRSNFGLNLACSSILTYMALADIKRDTERISLLTEKFYDALSKCKTEEELNNFNRFMVETTKIGGYAIEFYSSISSLINVNGKEKVLQILEDKKNDREKAVSRRIEHGIESKYFDIKYRPNGGLSELDINCSSLLTYMALADISRDEVRKRALDEQFMKTLSLCQNEEDFKNFATFMREISNVGGYAIKYNEIMSKYINENGKNYAVRYIAEQEIKNSMAKQEMKSKQTLLEEWREKFKKACILLEEIKVQSIKDDEEISYLIRVFNDLQTNLYDFTGIVEKDFISQMDVQLDEYINYLRGVYIALEEVSNIKHSM